MKAIPNDITIRELVEGYTDKQEGGVYALGGRLNVRPPYQREFVYDDKKRDAVISSIRKDYPLNVMYWARNADGTFEVLDGQQRTISICKYVTGDFSLDYQYFHNLFPEEKDQILDYKLMIRICDGTERDKLDWFKTINIAGAVLTEQELRNAVYTGTWLADAKLKFSKTNCPAYILAQDYVKGSPIRQELLETALEWISQDDVDQYMANHQNDPNANELWTYFRNVIGWVQNTFPIYRKEMKGINWGILYDQYNKQMFDTNGLETRIQQLLLDDDVTKYSGIYPFLLTGEEKYLHIRTFSAGDKRRKYAEQNGICPICGGSFAIEEMEADHIIPWSQGGATSIENCQMLCRACNRKKSDK